MADTTQKNVRKRHTVERIVIIVIIGILAGLSAFSINARMILKNPLPMPLGVGFAVVESGSMEPEIKTGDMIIVTPADDYKVGDVVTFVDGTISVTHRIVSIDGENVITKGDANDSEDSVINVGSICGKVAAVIPALGILVDALRSKVGLLVLIVAMILVIVLSFRKDRKTDESELELTIREIEMLKEELGKNGEKHEEV